MSIASLSGSIGAVRGLADAELFSAQFPGKISGLLDKVGTGEMSIFEAHNRENALMADKHNSDMRYEIFKILYEENKKKKMDYVKRNFGPSF